MKPMQQEKDLFKINDSYRLAKLTPHVIDRNGEGYLQSDVTKLIINEVITGIPSYSTQPYFKREFKNMNKELETAGQAFDDAFKIVSDKYLAFNDKTKEVKALTKKTGGEIRSAANDVAVSIEKIDKLADFAKLERMADTLERIAGALTTLSAIDENGSLSGVIQSITKQG